MLTISTPFRLWISHRTPYSSSTDRISTLGSHRDKYLRNRVWYSKQKSGQVWTIRKLGYLPQITQQCVIVSNFDRALFGSTYPNKNTYKKNNQNMFINKIFRLTFGSNAAGSNRVVLWVFCSFRNMETYPFRLHTVLCYFSCHLQLIHQRKKLKYAKVFSGHQWFRFHRAYSHYLP